MIRSGTDTYLIRLFVTIVIGTSGANVWAAACCGGSLSVPSLLLGDDKAQVTATASASQISTDVDSNGYWYRRSTPQSMQTYKLDGAALISDRWQVGGTLPVIFSQRAYTSGKTAGSGVGDIGINLGYEALPEWEYSEWRPRGIVFAQLIVPTGRSIFESNDPGTLDVTGRGVYSLGLGAAFTKTIARWDVLTVLQARRSIDRTVASPTAGGRVNLNPGWGGLAQVAAGYNLRTLRLGAGLSLNYEDPIHTTGASTHRGGLERFMTANISAAYMIDTEWAASLTYSDTRLFGAPANTTLGSTFSLALQKRWLR